MNYEYLNRLKAAHPAWRLLTADSAPFIISFLEKIFIEGNIRSIAESALEEKLEDYLLTIRSIYGDESYPRASSEYLDDWADSSRGWLRKYYPKTGDEAEFDITPHAEKVIEWLRSFEKKEFVGTESRLLLIFRMIRDLVNAAEDDPDRRIGELEKRKAEIDIEIQKIRSGLLSAYDSRQIKESFWRIEEEVRRLISDFREVEENFRNLDRQTRERIAAGAAARSDILDDIFREHDVIEHSDQGKSFAAFWLFLMSQSRQEELDSGTEKILSFDEIKNSGPTSLVSMKYSLLDAGDRVKRTLGSLGEQLRTFLDGRIYLENRRIMDIIKSVEENALAVRNIVPADKDFFSMDSVAPDVELPMERKLFTPPQKPPVMEDNPGEGSAPDIPDALYIQHYVDEVRLRDNIRRALAERTQVSLAEVCEICPVEKGLSEIITYMVIASRGEGDMINTDRQQRIEYVDKDEVKSVSLPLVIFSA
ncbi:MAG TPA: DUF3375 domain-containing protein [Spirochaetota bacterium]|nr:DUF3375 domain-containing protein [Spirochaetota bacterium]